MCQELKQPPSGLQHQVLDVAQWIEAWPIFPSKRFDTALQQCKDATPSVHQQGCHYKRCLAISKRTTMGNALHFWHNLQGVLTLPISQYTLTTQHGMVNVYIARHQVFKVHYIPHTLTRTEIAILFHRTTGVPNATITECQKWIAAVTTMGVTASAVALVTGSRAPHHRMAECLTSCGRSSKVTLL